VAALPQNYAYKDPAWTTTLDAAIKALGDGGDSAPFPDENIILVNGLIIPYILDNTVESNPAELTPIAAYGELTGTYITVVTTGLANARLVLVPTD